MLSENTIAMSIFIIACTCLLVLLRLNSLSRAPKSRQISANEAIHFLCHFGVKNYNPSHKLTLDEIRMI